MLQIASAAVDVKTAVAPSLDAKLTPGVSEFLLYAEHDDLVLYFQRRFQESQDDIAAQGNFSEVLAVLAGESSPLKLHLELYLAECAIEKFEAPRHRFIYEAFLLNPWGAVAFLQALLRNPNLQELSLEHWILIKLDMDADFRFFNWNLTETATCTVISDSTAVTTASTAVRASAGVDAKSDADDAKAIVPNTYTPLERAFLQALTNNHWLRTVKLQNCFWSAATWQTLFKWVGQHPTLRTVDFSDNAFRDFTPAAEGQPCQLMKDLALYGLGPTSQITHLGISHCDINFRDLGVLIPALITHRWLQSLNLSANPLATESVPVLNELFSRNSRLNWVNLMDCMLDTADHVAVPLFSQGIANTSLNVDLRGNRFRRDALCESLLTLPQLAVGVIDSHAYDTELITLDRISTQNRITQIENQMAVLRYFQSGEAARLTVNVTELLRLMGEYIGSLGHTEMMEYRCNVFKLAVLELQELFQEIPDHEIRQYISAIVRNIYYQSTRDNTWFIPWSMIKKVVPELINKLQALLVVNAFQSRAEQPNILNDVQRNLINMQLDKLRRIIPPYTPEYIRELFTRLEELLIKFCKEQSLETPAFIGDIIKARIVAIQENKELSLEQIKKFIERFLQLGLMHNLISNRVVASNLTAELSDLSHDLIGALKALNQPKMNRTMVALPPGTAITAGQCGAFARMAAEGGALAILTTPAVTVGADNKLGFA